jgi:hypothetical protein
MPTLPDAGVDRLHYSTELLAVVFPSHLFNKPQAGLIKRIYLVFKCVAGELGDNLKAGCLGRYVEDTQTFHELLNLTLGDNVLARVLSFWRFTTLSACLSWYGHTRSFQRGGAFDTHTYPDAGSRADGRGGSSSQAAAPPAFLIDGLLADSSPTGGAAHTRGSLPPYVETL